MYGHSDTIYSLSFSRDGNQLASAGADNAVRIWDPKSAETTEISKVVDQSTFGKKMKRLEKSYLLIVY
jgi:WD40 repeat protein